MKIEIEVSEDNEGTESPWWIIVDPRQNMRADYHDTADQIKGPFFSREEAENVLKCRSHRFSRKAVVYCVSGYMTEQYKEKYRAAEKLKREHPTTKESE